jgi:hypothetical protein
MTSFIARLRYLDLRHYDRLASTKDDLYSILRYGENLRSVELHDFTEPPKTPRITCHAKAPLRRLVLSRLAIPSSPCHRQFGHFSRTLRHVVLKVTLPGDAWEEPMEEFKRCSALIYFSALDAVALLMYPFGGTWTWRRRDMSQRTQNKRE